MKILFHHRIASKDGQHVHIEELTQALQRLGHETVVVGPAALEESAFGSESAAISLLKRFMPSFVYEVLELGYSLIAFCRLAKAVRQHRPDCIYERYNLYMPAGIWIKRRYKLPFLLEVNAPLCDERSRYTGLTLKALARWSETYAWRGADHVLPVTEVLAKRVREAGVAPDLITVIPNGIDTEKFSDTLDRVEAKKQLGLQGRVVLGFTGFVRDWHGLERVIHIVAGNPGDRHLLIVGDGPARDSIERLAAALGVASRVTITGVVDRKRIANYVAAFDVALQPDVVSYASPLKLFEYMSMGRAIVAPDRDNIREVLRDEHDALLFDPQNADAFAQAVERLCADEALRMRIADNARRTIHERDYTWDNNARKVVSLFCKAGVRTLPESAFKAAHEAENQ